MTFLAIDVGNTRLKWAMYDAPKPGAAVLAHGAEFLDHIERLADSAWAGLPAPTRMLGCVVAGDAVRRRVMEQMEWWDVPSHWVVPSAEEAGLVNGYDHPTRLGSDRWVAMIGARHRLLRQGPARPLVVVMVGTAVTVEAIDAEGRFLGGLILPGARHHAAGPGIRHRGAARSHRRSEAVPHQHQRCAHQRRHLRHRRRRRAHGAACHPALRRRARVHDDRGQAGKWRPA